MPLGNLVGIGHHRRRPVWDICSGTLLTIVLANVLGMLVGFMLGVVIRNSAGAIVAYFVYSLLLPTLSMLLAAQPGVVRATCSRGSTSTTPRARCSTGT